MSPDATNPAVEAAYRARIAARHRPVLTSRRYGPDRRAAYRAHARIGTLLATPMTYLGNPARRWGWICDTCAATGDCEHLTARSALVAVADHYEAHHG